MILDGSSIRGLNTWASILEKVALEITLPLHSGSDLQKRYTRND